MLEVRSPAWRRRAWPLVRHAIAFEVRLYRSLFRWLARRPDHGGGDDLPVGYARLVTPVMWLWIFGSACEIPLVHVLVPWDGVRVALLVIGVWGLMWMVGLLASLYVYPHLLGPDQVRIRYGTSSWATVAWEDVAEVTTRERDLPSSMWVVQDFDSGDGPGVAVAVAGRTNLELRLHRPTLVPTSKGEREVVAVALWVDEPREVAAHIRAQRS